MRVVMRFMALPSSFAVPDPMRAACATPVEARWIRVEIGCTRSGSVTAGSAGVRFRSRARSEEWMEYHVLGPLEVVRDGRTLELGAGKQRTLLAALLLNANEVVSTDRLIDALWGDQVPATAPKIVQGYVSRLRRVLDGDDERPEQIGPPRGEGALLTRSPGYVLRVEEGQLDSARFATLLTQARA